MYVEGCCKHWKSGIRIRSSLHNSSKCVQFILIHFVWYLRRTHLVIWFTIYVIFHCIVNLVHINRMILYYILTHKYMHFCDSSLSNCTWTIWYIGILILCQLQKMQQHQNRVFLRNSVHFYMLYKIYTTRCVVAVPFYHCNEWMLQDTRRQSQKIVIHIKSLQFINQM